MTAPPKDTPRRRWRSFLADADGLRVKLGFEFRYELTQPTPMIALLSVHPTRFGALEMPDFLTTNPLVPLTHYLDGFGNVCTRLLAPAGEFSLSSNSVIRDAGRLDPIFSEARQHPVEELPNETLVYLQGSRYVDTDLLSDEAWKRFATVAPGWRRVQAICDFVHEHVTFGYEHARPTQTASQTLANRRGVCRDYTHLAIALARCMNIPARYCTGYLSDIGEPEPHPPGDFAAWMEVYLSGRWRVFDPRNNKPRLARVLVARGRDAADVPLIQTFGPNNLAYFDVCTEEMPDKSMYFMIETRKVAIQ